MLMNLDLVEIINIVVVAANWVFRLFKHLFELLKTFISSLVRRFVLFNTWVGVAEVFDIFRKLFNSLSFIWKKGNSDKQIGHTGVKNLILAFHIFLCVFLCSQYGSTDHIDHIGLSYLHLQPHLYILYKGILESYEGQC